MITAIREKIIRAALKENSEEAHTALTALVADHTRATKAVDDDRSVLHAKLREAEDRVVRALSELRDAKASLNRLGATLVGTRAVATESARRIDAATDILMGRVPGGGK